VMTGLNVLKTVGKSVDDDPRSGRPSTSTDGAHVTKVNEIVRSNRRLISLFYFNLITLTII